MAQTAVKEPGLARAKRLAEFLEKADLNKKWSWDNLPARVRADLRARGVFPAYARIILRLT